jgi:hypothetical protein
MIELRPHSGNRATSPDDLKSLHLPSGNRPQSEIVGRANYNKGRLLSIFHITFVIRDDRSEALANDKYNMENYRLPVLPHTDFRFFLLISLPLAYHSRVVCE